MNIELEQKIYSIDEVFFREKDYDKTITCMCWGIECGDGWYEPIRKFVEKVAVLNSLLKPIGTCIVCEQMKSKWAAFTCYWGIRSLNDENTADEFDEKAEKLCQIADRMMCDAVNGCELECSQTCELCGKHDPWGDDVIVCGSWLTVKCIDCAQKGAFEEGTIHVLNDGFKFLSILAKNGVKIGEDGYPTLIGAYYGTLSPSHKDIFKCMTVPKEIFVVAKSLGLSEIDDRAAKIMKHVAKECFMQHDDLRQRLLATNGLKIVNGNHINENGWGACYCDERKGKGNNIYGELLMEIRNELAEETVKK